MKAPTGKTLRVYRIDLNDARTVPAIPSSHQYAGSFKAVPATGVRLLNIQTGQPIPPGALVLVYQKTNVR